MAHTDLFELRQEAEEGLVEDKVEDDVDDVGAVQLGLVHALVVGRLFEARARLPAIDVVRLLVLVRLVARAVQEVQQGAEHLAQELRRRVVAKEDELLGDLQYLGRQAVAVAAVGRHHLVGAQVPSRGAVTSGVRPPRLACPPRKSLRRKARRTK